MKEPPFIGACIIPSQAGSTLFNYGEKSLIPSHLLPTTMTESMETITFSNDLHVVVTDEESKEMNAYEEKNFSSSVDMSGSDVSMSQNSSNTNIDSSDSESDNESRMEYELASVHQEENALENDDSSSNGSDESDEDKTQISDDDPIESSSESEVEEEDDPVKTMIDDASDCDGYKINILLQEKSYEQAFQNFFGEDNDELLLMGSLERDVLIAKKMVQVFIKGGFQNIYGSACRVYVPEFTTTLNMMMDKFSVKKGKCRVNKQVPENMIGQEMLLCTGPLEIAISPKSVDIPSDKTSFEEEDAEKLTMVRIVKVLKFLGYSGAELNPKCAATKKVLKHDCLKYSHLTLEVILTAIFASRASFFSIAGFFGARVKLNIPNGAYDNFWMWKQYLPKEFDMQKHLVRLDMAYNIKIPPGQLVQITGVIDGEVTSGVRTDDIFSPEAIGERHVRVSRTFFNGWTAAREQRSGAVTLQFEHFNLKHSPSQVSKIKIYNTIAHNVRMTHELVSGDSNIKDQLSKFIVKRVQNGAEILLKVFHKSIDYLNEYGTCIRIESTIVSCYDHASDRSSMDPECVDLKFCGEEEWIQNHYWAVNAYYSSHFNVVPEVLGAPEILIAPFYRVFTLIQIALRRRVSTHMKDLGPKETNLIYITYLYTMLRSFAGYAGERHHHAIKSYIEAPYGTYPDFSGTLFLLNEEKNASLPPGTYIDPIGHTPTLEGEQLLRFEQRDFLITSLSGEDEKRALNLMNNSSHFGKMELDHEMDWFKEKLNTIVQQRLSLLSQALDKNVLKSQELKDICGKHYHKIGIDKLQRIFGLDAVDKRSALKQGSCVLLYNVIPFRGEDATHTGFKQMVAAIGGSKTRSASSELPYLEEDIDRLDALLQQITFLYQDKFEPLPRVSAENINDTNAPEEVFFGDDDHVPTIEEVIEECTEVPGTEPWSRNIAECIQSEDKIFAKVKYARRKGGIKLDDVDEGSKMIDMSQKIKENLNALYEYLGNKTKMIMLSNSLNIFSRDLKQDKKASAMDVMNRICGCYEKKYPGIFTNGKKVYFAQPDKIDDSEDEEYEDDGYGENGKTSRSSLSTEAQEYLEKIENRRASYSTRSRAGNQIARNQWEAIHEENSKLQNILNQE